MNPSPIYAATSELVWGIVSAGLLVLLAVLVVLLVRWAGFRLGFLIGGLRQRPWSH